jgi:hypothetical protein
MEVKSKIFWKKWPVDLEWHGCMKVNIPCFSIFFELFLKTNPRPTQNATARACPESTCHERAVDGWHIIAEKQ